MRILTAKLRDIFTQFSYLPRIFRLIWVASKGYTLAWAILLVIQGVLPALSVYLIRVLVDSLTKVIGAGASWENARAVLVPAALMATILLLTELLNRIIEWVRTVQSETIQDYLSALIHEKSLAVELAFYESPEYHDRLERARSDSKNRSLALLENSGSLLQNGITLIAMAVILIPYGIWLPVMLLMSTFPALYVVVRFNLHYHQWWKQTTHDRRKAQYYDLILTGSWFAPELRLFGLGTHFRSAYQELRRRLRTERIGLAKEQALSQVGAGIVALLISSGTICWMGWRALNGVATLGDLALFYQAFNQGQGLMGSLLGNVGQIYSNSLFLGNLFEFLELEPQIVDPSRPIPAPDPLKDGIRFCQVTFRYPGSERAALQNFNLTIRAGQTVAIVGANGAGKSTLLKLLCRFYDPECGSIEFDGMDIRHFSLEELRYMITVLFQFPVSYYVTAGQNIAFGDLKASPSTAEIETAARGAGAHEFIVRLPQGYDTPLGKWFADGAELSGGEWQRIALARAFLRQASIIVLDEPTSFMDSWAEMEWLKRFRELAHGRTAIIITHRFTTAMRADIIHVMDEGQIVESGSHDELMAQRGLYAQSWVAQMQVEAKHSS